MTSPTSTSGQAEALEVLAWFTNSKVGGPRLRGTGDVSNNPEYVSLYSEWRWEPLVRLADADARIAAAESRAAAAEADARRYRWLRESDMYVGPAPEGDLIGVSWNDWNEGELDAAVDAAIKEGA